jgi:hypothetical protein
MSKVYTYSDCQKFFRYGTCSQNPNPPYPPFVKGGDYRELLEKSIFGKGGFIAKGDEQMATCPYCQLMTS